MIDEIVSINSNLNDDSSADEVFRIDAIFRIDDAGVYTFSITNVQEFLKYLPIDRINDRVWFWNRRVYPAGTCKISGLVFVGGENKRRGQIEIVFRPKSWHAIYLNAKRGFIVEDKESRKGKLLKIGNENYSVYQIYEEEDFSKIFGVD